MSGQLEASSKRRIGRSRQVSSISILLAHSQYGSASPSGENIAVAGEIELLTQKGHPVALVRKCNDEALEGGKLAQLKAGAMWPWNLLAVREVKSACSKQVADVLHVHNTFPLLSNGVLYAPNGRCARVLTLHNYRLFCAAGIPMRDERVCTDCLIQRSAWRSEARLLSREPFGDSPTFGEHRTASPSGDVVEASGRVHCSE